MDEFTTDDLIMMHRYLTGSLADDACRVRRKINDALERRGVFRKHGTWWTDARTEHPSCLPRQVR
jgi:hypothetical protein